MQGRAPGHEEFRVFGKQGVTLGQREGIHEALAQGGQKGQRAAEKGDLAPDFPPAGQTADHLIHNSLKNGGGNIFLGASLVEQGQNVGFGEYAAAGGDGIKLMMVDGQSVEALRVGIEKGRHLIDEGPGAARAGFVHALFHSAGEECDFGVLPSQLYGDVGVRNNMPDAAAEAMTSCTKVRFISSARDMAPEPVSERVKSCSLPFTSLSAEKGAASRASASICATVARTSDIWRW